MKDHLFKTLPIGSKFMLNHKSPVFTKESEDLKFKQHGKNITLFEHTLVLVD